MSRIRPHADRPSTMHVARVWLLGAVFILVGGQTVAAHGEDEAVDFRRDVYPILKAHCFACHAGRDAESGYRLDLRAEILGATNGEPLVEVGNSEKSRLIELVARVDPDEVMPPVGEGEPLSEKQINILRAWIEGGLAWDDTLLPSAAGDGSGHWAFQPVKRPPLPETGMYDGAWVRTPVDAFVSARHGEQGLAPSPPADRRTLIVRATLDLLGIPPTPEEVDAFAADPSPNAYPRLIDRLLASPHYGERWGRHWLDVARWAESEGYESNHPRPFAWRYRDWVVDAFNSDKPYDEFVTQQIAGDELVPYADENLIATGFLAAARISSNEEDKALQRNDTLVDIVNATGSAFLGLTVGCAQCHNHKFDPVTQRDYYRLQAFFIRGMPNNFELRSEQLWQQYRAEAPPEYEAVFNLKHMLFERGRQAFIEEVKQDFTPEMLAALETPEAERTPRQHELYRQADLQFQLTPGGYERYIPEEDKRLYNEAKKKLEALKKQMRPKPQTWAYYSPATSPHQINDLPQIGFYPLPYEPAKLCVKPAYLLVRGDVHHRGPQLSPGVPVVLNTNPQRQRGGRAKTSAASPSLARRAGVALRDGEFRTRSDLALWLTDRDNPLTARVWVNRIWQHHFGCGIVATPGDFGLEGVPPTHPALLDWLAVELMESGWSTKHIHRLITLSATYRQASSSPLLGKEQAGEVPSNAHSTSNTPANSPLASGRTSRDPENKFLWRFPIRRLQAEAIRDSLLAVSGELDRAIGGPHREDSGDDEDADREDASTDKFRRTLYLHQKRDAFPAMQRLFDGPSANESCARRHVSTVALQPLYLLNNDFVYARAEAVARRVEQTAGGDVNRQVDAAFELVLLRRPNEDERAAALEFLGASAYENRLAQLCHALLNTNEFIYLE